MEISTEVLGRLLLVQSTLHAMVGPRQLASFVASALVRVPGVRRAAFCQHGQVLGVAPHGAVLDPSPEGCPAICGANPRSQRPECELVSSQGFSIVALRTSFNHYGSLCLQIDDAEEYAKYLPFIESVANVLALSLESRAQADEIRRAADALETRVKERTAELEAAHAKLREQEHLIARILETAPTAIYIYDIVQQKNVFTNERIETILGYSPQEIQTFGSELFSTVLHPEDLATVEQHQERLREASDGEVVEVEYRMCHADGSYRILHSWETIFSRDERRQPVRAVGVALDVTQARESENRRADLEQQMAASQRLEAIGRLAGGVAHDFNNIITVINNYAEFGLDESTTPEEQRENLEQILMAGRRAAALTQQLLAFSRKQVLRPAPTSLNHVILGMESMLRRIIGEDIEFEAKLSEDDCQALVDVARLEQVVMNLVINARDAMPGGGRLLIETKRVYLDAIEVKGDSAPLHGDFVVLSVRDNGVGMQEATQQRIFEPFFTTKPAGQGTGLGLATAHGIVRQSGGDIRVRSVPGAGSAFEVYLPSVAEVGESQLQDAKRPSAAAKCGRETILVVDDEESVLRIAERILGSAGYRVLAAADANQAMDLGERYSAQVQLLLTDVVMPVMDGRALAERLSARIPNLKVVYMSGYTASISGDHWVLDPGTKFVAKPFSAMELRATVADALLNDSVAKRCPSAHSA